MRYYWPALLMLAACNRDETPETPTAAEKAQLDDAEAMLNEMANEEGPAVETAGPSNSQ